MSPQQTDIIEHHYKVYERLQKIKAETEEVSTKQRQHKLVEESAQLEANCVNLCNSGAPAAQRAAKRSPIPM